MQGLLNFIYRFYPLAIAALLAAGATWLERATRGPEPVTDATVSKTPDFIAETVRITGFSANGKLYYTLDSPHLTHLPTTDITQIEQPRLYLIAQERQMWVKAEYGEAGPRGQQIDFTGNVEVERESPPPDPPLFLFSAQITVWPQEQRAASNVPVRAVQGESSVVGNNFAADNVFGSMKLSGKVHMHLASRPQRNRRNP